jgi:uroporphyrinogen decarboxylase
MQEMTSRERITAAIKHEPVDRIPISPRLNMTAIGYQTSSALTHIKLQKNEFPGYDPHFQYPPDVYPANLNTLFNGAWGNINYTNDVNINISTKDAGDSLNITTIFETPAGKLQQVKILPKPGAGQYGANPNPHIAEFAIKDKSDLEKYNYLLPPSSTFSIDDYLDFEQMFYDDAMPLISIPGPMDHTGGNAVAMETMMIAYYEDREFFDAVFNRFFEFSLEQLQWSIERGVKNFFLTWFYESLSAGWSPTIYQEVFAPMIKQQVELIHAVDGLACMYDDGHLMKSLPFIAETGIDLLETCTPAPMGDFDVVEAKKLYGNKLAFKGGMDIVNVIAMGTPKDIDDAMKNLVEVGAQGSGFIIGTCDSIRPETPKANVQAFFASAEKYAKEFAKLTQ